MLKLLSFFFPCVRRLIELKNTQKKLIGNLELQNKEQFVLIEPFDRRSQDYLETIARLWQNKALKWLLVSCRQDVMSNMLKNGTAGYNAEAYRNQIIGINFVIDTMEDARLQSEIQISQT